MKRRIAVDVDGVLADLVAVLAAELGREPDSFTTPRFADGDFTPVEVSRMERLMVSPGFVRRLPLYHNAGIGMAELHTCGEVVIVTHQYEASPTWVFDRAGWLLEHFPDVPVIFTKAKHMVDADVLVEDTPANAVKFVEAVRGRSALLVARPWNEEWRAWSGGSGVIHTVADMREAASFLA